MVYYIFEQRTQRLMTILHPELSTPNDFDYSNLSLCNSVDVISSGSTIFHGRYPIAELQSL